MENQKSANSSDTEKYAKFRQEVLSLLREIPDYAAPKPLRPFAKAYISYYTYMPGRECLLDFPEDMPVFKMGDNLSQKMAQDAKIHNVIIDFLAWIQRDMRVFVKEAFSVPRLTDREIDILNRRCENETFKSIAQSYGLSATRIQAIDEHAVRRARGHCVSGRLRNNLFMLMYAMQSCKRQLTADDFMEYLDAKYVKYLWYMIRRGKFDCEYLNYSKDTDTLNFNI